MITVSIVEDHRDTRESLVALVNGTKGLRCLCTYSTGEAALRGMPVEKPQIALVDINLPGMSGIECVARLKAQMPSLEVLMLTTYEETELIFNSLRAGANGYLLKNMPPDELIAALEQVHAGGAPSVWHANRPQSRGSFPPNRDPSDVGKLTPREHEILTLLAKGCLDKEIVGKLGISFTTVRTHLKHIYEKAACANPHGGGRPKFLTQHS